MTYKKFLRILNTNSKDNPLNIDHYDRQDLINNKKLLTNKFVSFYVSFTCLHCNTLITKNFKDPNCNLDFLLYCSKCLRKFTCISHYGCKTNLQSEETKNKSKKTKLQKYGNENYNNSDKHRKTCIERYGVINYTKTSEYKRKVRKTSLKKYGVKHYTQSEEVKEHLKQSNQEKYGVDWQTQSDNFKKKAKKTRKQRYGVEYSMQSEEFKEKSRQTMLRKYGSIRPKTGKYQYDNLLFDSSWELVFYMYYKDKNYKIIREPCSFDYTVNHIVHKYYPDFKIRNKYYEIKGEQFIIRYKNGKVKSLCDVNKTITDNSKAKYKCIKRHNIILITYIEIQKYFEYVDQTYGLSYIEQFKI